MTRADSAASCRASMAEAWICISEWHSDIISQTTRVNADFEIKRLLVFWYFWILHSALTTENISWNVMINVASCKHILPGRTWWWWGIWTGCFFAPGIVFQAALAWRGFFLTSLPTDLLAVCLVWAIAQLNKLARIFSKVIY